MALQDNDYDSDDVALDRKTWESRFQDLLEKSPEFAEGLARTLFSLLRVARSGPRGFAETQISLKYGVEFAYLYTDVHRSAFELFMLYIDGNLEIADEPKGLIGEAVARGAANAKKSRKRKRSKSAGVGE